MKTVMGEPAAAPVPGARVAAARSIPGALARIRDRLRPFEYPLLVIVAVGLVAAGQLVEDMADSSPIQMLTPQAAARRWTVIALVLYELVIAGVLSQTVRRSLESLRRVVKVDRATFQEYERRMQGWGARQDVAVLLISGLIVALLFWVLRLELLSDDPVTKVGTHLPTDPVRGGIVLAGYAVLGWAGLRLLIITTRLGRLLGRLSREPLEINVFDTTPLLPMGNIALAVALAPAGIIVVLLIGFGGPTSPVSWTTLVLATVASLLALLLPLRATHRQMAHAKYSALTVLGTGLRTIYDDVSISPNIETADTVKILNTTNTLIGLRNTALQMTTWPFRDTVAFGRAVLIASAPLIYTTLSELIKIFWLGPLAP
jgi:hypothetical protein